MNLRNAASLQARRSPFTESEPLLMSDTAAPERPQIDPNAIRGRRDLGDGVTVTEYYEDRAPTLADVLPRRKGAMR